MWTRGVRKAFLSFLSFFCILPTSWLQDTSFCTVYSRNWPMRGKWVLSVILGSLFQCCHLETIQATEKAWILGSIFFFILLPIWCGNINFIQHFFPICGNPVKLRSRINLGWKIRNKHPVRKTRCLKTLMFVKGWLKFIKQLQGFKTMVYCQQLFYTLSESPM